jgi:O-antigen ligase
LPLIAVLVSQAMNDQIHIARYDAPSRYALSLIIFFALIQFKNVVRNLLEFSFPLASYLTLMLLPFMPQEGWAGANHGRLTVYFIDPLIFGQLTLVFGVLSFYSVWLGKNRAWWISIFKIIAGFIGIYLSLASQSRTGWLAVPLILSFWLLFKTPGGLLKKVMVGLIGSVIISFAAYNSSNIIKSRISDMRTEIASYHWDSMNEYSSIGARISWIRVGFYYFELRPLSGWGELSLRPRIDDPQISLFSNEATREELLQVGFHNDYIANMVRYGVLGLISTVFIFLIPLSFFVYCIRKNLCIEYAGFGITYILIQSISSLSYHILDFKFMASFYALMIVIITGMIFEELKTKKD